MHQWIQAVAGSGKTTLLINKLLILSRANTDLYMNDIACDSGQVGSDTISLAKANPRVNNMSCDSDIGQGDSNTMLCGSARIGADPISFDDAQGDLDITSFDSVDGDVSMAGFKVNGITQGRHNVDVNLTAYSPVKNSADRVSSNVHGIVHGCSNIDCFRQVSFSTASISENITKDNLNINNLFTANSNTEFSADVGHHDYDTEGSNADNLSHYSSKTRLDYDSAQDVRNIRSSNADNLNQFSCNGGLDSNAHQNVQNISSSNGNTMTQSSSNIRFDSDAAQSTGNTASLNQNCLAQSGSGANITQSDPNTGFILCVSFARASVREMQNKFISLVKRQQSVNPSSNACAAAYDISNINFTTLHGFASNFSQQEVDSSAYIKNSAWQILLDLCGDKDALCKMFIEDPDWTSWVENYSELIVDVAKGNTLSRDATYYNSFNEEIDEQARHLHTNKDSWFAGDAPPVHILDTSCRCNHTNDVECSQAVHNGNQHLYNTSAFGVITDTTDVHGIENCKNTSLSTHMYLCQGSPEFYNKQTDYHTQHLTISEIEELKSALAELKLDLESCLQNDLSATARKKLGDAAALFDRYKFQHYLVHEKEFTRGLVSMSRLWQDIMNYLQDKYNLTSYNGLLINGIRALRSKLYTSGQIPQHILIDEAQDLTALQWEFIYALFTESLAIYPDATITVVGDPNQIIYGFQGSGINVWQNGLRWWNGLPGVKEHSIRSCCYRCGGAIIEVVNKLFTPLHISEASHITQSWVEVYEPADGVFAERLLSYILTQAFKYDDILILVKRRGVVSRSIIDTFNRAGVKISGLSDNLLNDIEIIANFVNAMDFADDLAIFQALEHIYCAENHVNPSVDIGQFEQLQQDIIARTGSIFEVLNDLYPNIAKFLRDLSYAQQDCGKFLYILSGYINIDPRVTQLAASWCSTGSGCIDEFVMYAKSHNYLSTEPVPNHVRLLTIHAAKGLQSKYVIIADAYDSPYKIIRDIDFSSGDIVWPNENNLAKRRAQTLHDSRNLLYVAMTRAECGLIVCGSGNKHKQSFADEIYSALEDIQGVVDTETALGVGKRLVR